MRVTWNFSRRRFRQYKSADVLIFSVAKSGRTWLRVLLNKYLSLLYNIPFDINNLCESNPQIPFLFFNHEYWTHYSEDSWWDYMRGEHICPDKMLNRKKVILLSRDPRDVVVSLYFQKTKRSENKIVTEMSHFIRNEKYGINGIIHVMNIWRERLRDNPHTLWTGYEDLRTDTYKELERIVKFLNLKEVNSDMIHEAIAFADFKNMLKMEREHVFDNPILLPGNMSDPDSFKVRKGKVGDYINYFNKSDIEYLNHALKSLDNFYGYTEQNVKIRE